MAPDYIRNISKANLSIYDPISIGDPCYWIPTSELETILNNKLRGISLGNLPLRTRSKILKIKVCESLGYTIPPSFRKTKPRFPGQNFDTYIQKSNNLQIWNEEVSPNRRYVIIKVSNDDIISCVKVISGNILAKLDTTGTLTQKYQARLNQSACTCELISTNDTQNLLKLLSENTSSVSDSFPTDVPTTQFLLPIKTLFTKLKQLVGQSFTDPGIDQERNRGSILHKTICTLLGYKSYKDDGRFPDIRHQLLEVKLQTSPTIDLGLIAPNSITPIDIPAIDNIQIRHCDIRYALFYACIKEQKVTLTHFFLTTGELFFNRFPQFQGNVLNKKLQIPLPNSFFRF